MTGALAPFSYLVRIGLAKLQ